MPKVGTRLYQCIWYIMISWSTIKRSMGITNRQQKPHTSTRLLCIPRYCLGWVKFTYPVLFAGCRVKPFPGGRYVGGAALEVFGPNRGVNLNRHRQWRWLVLQASVVQWSNAVSCWIFGGSDVGLQTAQRSAFRVAATKLFYGNRAPRVYNRNARRKYLLGYIGLGSFKFFLPREPYAVNE